MDYSHLLSELQKMSEKIDLIPGINTRLISIENRLYSVETRLSSVESDVSTLKINVSNLTKNFVFYTKQDTKIQESTNEELIYNYLKRAIPSSTFEKKERFEFVDLAGSIITELDGCILMNSSSIPEPPLFIANISSMISLKDDSHRVSFQLVKQLTILIESKRILNIPRLNKKIQQLIAIENILRSLPITNASEKFMEMAFKQNISAFPKDVIMIFGSYDISDKLKDFIMEINNQTLNEYKYEKYLCDCFKKDMFYAELKQDSRISRRNKNNLDLHLSTYNINAIRTACLASEYGSRSNNLLLYFPDYTSVENLYNQVNGKLGVLYGQELIQPELIPMTSTIELVGGSRSRSTIKRRKRHT